MSESADDKKRDDILKRLLETRPEPHKKKTPRAKKKPGAKRNKKPTKRKKD